MGLFIIGLLYRLLDLSVFNRAFLLEQSQSRILRKINITAHRGMVLDRLGSPLAISTSVQSVWVNPTLFKPTKHEVNRLAHLLRVSRHYILHQVCMHQKREFVYLKRALPPQLAKRIKALKIQGVFFQRESRRYYPEGGVSAHVVGFTNIDDQGQEGVELAYNQWLQGSVGKKEVLKDRLGNEIAEIALLKKPSQGKNIQLSIDHRIQYVAYRALESAVQKYHAASGSVVVLDVETGEVLAMANQPSYNPNKRHRDDVSSYRNRAVTDVYEPGSIIKPFTIALALESGKYTPDTRIDTDHGWMKIGGYKIHDDLDYGVVTLTELLQKSSNIAAAKILLSLSPRAYWDLLHQLGFGEPTASGFPGEASGKVAPQTTWVPSVVATLAYGYGISVTALQMASAYSTLASGGIRRPVTFLKIDQEEVSGVRVLPGHVARQVVNMLETVVKKGGTGTRAAVGRYRVAGKTGTAYIADSKGYSHRHYMASFVGLAPVQQPKIVVAVVIKDPQGKHFGGLVAAPVFSDIMRGTLRLLDIPPG